MIWQDLLNEPWRVVVLLLVGALTSFINSFAGGGSALSLPALIFMGLPPAVANGTNRIGLWFGAASSSFAFVKNKQIEWKEGIFPGILSSLGAIAGALGSVNMPEKWFKILIALVIIWVVYNTCFVNRNKPKQKKGPPLNDNSLVTSNSRTSQWAPLTYFFMGFYGGLIQIGVGFVMQWGFQKIYQKDLVKINALKMMTALWFVSVAVIIFAYYQSIAWIAGIILALGNIAGGWIGSHLQMKKGDGFIKKFVFVAGLASAIRLIWMSLN